MPDVPRRRESKSEVRARALVAAIAHQACAIALWWLAEPSLHGDVGDAVMILILVVLLAPGSILAMVGAIPESATADGWVLLAVILAVNCLVLTPFYFWLLPARMVRGSAASRPPAA